jgi:hypothetical protein
MGRIVSETSGLGRGRIGARDLPVEAIPTECRPFADDLSRGGR